MTDSVPPVSSSRASEAVRYTRSIVPTIGSRKSSGNISRKGTPKALGGSTERTISLAPSRTWAGPRKMAIAGGGRWKVGTGHSDKRGHREPAWSPRRASEVGGPRQRMIVRVDRATYLALH